MSANIPDFSQSRVLVAGDVMLDRYWKGATERISPEAPVPVVHVRDIEERLGGAGNVALNVSALGGSAYLLGVCGIDEAGKALGHLLQNGRVENRLQADSAVPTCTKLRILSRHQQLIRADFESNLSVANFDGFLKEYDNLLSEVGAVVLSDYGKGTLCKIEFLISLAKRKGRPVLVDPKGTDYERYKGVTVITPNMHEFEAVVGHCETEDILVERAENLRKELELEALLVTRGEAGMTLIREQMPPFHLTAHARDVFDVTGAGDTVIATLAAGLAAGAGFEKAMEMANIAAGIVVGKVGTAVAGIAEIKCELNGKGKGFQNGIVSEEELVGLVETAKSQGDRIVMTSGNYDVLQFHHVAFFEKARKLGDRLIVAVNDYPPTNNGMDDEEGRPVNRLKHRMAVLAGLQAVDWVVPVAKSMMEPLCRKIIPHIIVKMDGNKIGDAFFDSNSTEESGRELYLIEYEKNLKTPETLQQFWS